jgi:hypothetical protein
MGWKSFTANEQRITMDKFKVGDRVIPKRIAAGASQGKRNYLNNVYTIVFRHNHLHYPFIYSLGSNTPYSWAEEELELEINNINQVCALCKMPCPHQNPNQADKTYMCVACLTIKELSLNEQNQKKGT